MGDEPELGNRKPDTGTDRKLTLTRRRGACGGRVEIRVASCLTRADRQAGIAVALAEPLRLRFFLGLLAGLALLLGAVGVYGVVSYAVARWRTECGIRMALGAARGNVLGLVMRSGMLPVVAGAVAGTLASLGLSQAVRGFLYETSPTDGLSLMAAASTVLLAGVFAALMPAWRAGSVSPMEALRSD